MALDWKATIRQLAPALGTAVGGPVGGLALGLLSKAILGKDGPAKPEELEAAVGAGLNGDQLLALKEAEQQFAEKMRELEIDVFRLEVQDKASARELFKVNVWPQISISALYIVGYFSTLGLVLSGKVQIPPDMKETATILLSILAAAVPVVLQFWFGSSAGGAQKSAMLAASKPPDA